MSASSGNNNLRTIPDYKVLRERGDGVRLVVIDGQVMISRSGRAAFVAPPVPNKNGIASQDEQCRLHMPKDSVGLGD